MYELHALSQVLLSLGTVADICFTASLIGRLELVGIQVR